MRLRYFWVLELGTEELYGNLAKLVDSLHELYVELSDSGVIC